MQFSFKSLHWLGYLFPFPTCASPSSFYHHYSFALPPFLMIVSGLNTGVLEEIMAQLEQSMMHDGSLVVCPC